MRSRTVPWGLAWWAMKKSLGKLGFTTQIWPGAQIDLSSRFSLVRLITIETILGKERHEKRWRKVGWGWESLITLGPKWKYDDQILSYHDGKRKTRDGEAGDSGTMESQKPNVGLMHLQPPGFRSHLQCPSVAVCGWETPGGTPILTTKFHNVLWALANKWKENYITYRITISCVYTYIQTYTSTYMRINYTCDTWHLHIHSHVHNYMYIMCLHKHLRYVGFRISFKACILKKS